MHYIVRRGNHPYQYFAGVYEVAAITLSECVITDVWTKDIDQATILDLASAQDIKQYFIEIKPQKFLFMVTDVVVLQVSIE